MHEKGNVDYVNSREGEKDEAYAFVDGALCGLAFGWLCNRFLSKREAL